MSEDVYVLEKEVNGSVLDKLNGERSIFLALKYSNGREDFDQIVDWINAIESENKIVNPLSPREELNKEFYYRKKEYAEHGTQYDLGAAYGIKKAIKTIAKDPKHADVSDWLKDGDPNA